MLNYFEKTNELPPIAIPGKNSKALGSGISVPSENRNSSETSDSTENENLTFPRNRNSASPPDSLETHP